MSPAQELDGLGQRPQLQEQLVDADALGTKFVFKRRRGVREITPLPDKSIPAQAMQRHAQVVVVLSPQQGLQFAVPAGPSNERPQDLRVQSVLRPKKAVGQVEILVRQRVREHEARHQHSNYYAWIYRVWRTPGNTPLFMRVLGSRPKRAGLVSERVTDRLLLVGTAHVSAESAREAEAAIREFKPDAVAVELDPVRLDVLENKQQWESTTLLKMIKSDRLWLFLTQIMLASYQRRLGEMYGSAPGMEMLAAVKAGREQGAEIALVDRDVGITMKRAYRSMRFGEKTRLVWELFKASMGGEIVETATGGKIEESKAAPMPLPIDLTKEDLVTEMMRELGEIAPSVKTVVLDERDTYLAARIQRLLADGKRVVAVVGAGHFAGIKAKVLAAEPPPDLAPLETVPVKRFSIAKFLFAWAIPGFVLALFVYLGYQGYQEGNWQGLQDAAVAWILLTGACAAIGAALARAHILSIATAFVAAPITTLHPALAAGWFAAAVEAYVRAPTTKDFQGLSNVKRLREFFTNPVLRVVMVAAFANLGAMAGVFIAVPTLIEGKPLPSWLPGV